MFYFEGDSHWLYFLDNSQSYFLGNSYWPYLWLILFDRVFCDFGSSYFLGNHNYSFFLVSYYCLRILTGKLSQHSHMWRSCLPQLVYHQISLNCGRGDDFGTATGQ